MNERQHRQCRFCQDRGLERQLLKYGVRHYAHAECLVRKLGVDALAALPSGELATAPVLVLRDMGIDAMALWEAAQRREGRGGDPRRADGEGHAKTP